MMMKHLFLVSATLCGMFAALHGAVPAAPAAQAGLQGTQISLPPESISLSTGESRKFEVPFQVEHARAGNTNARISHVEGRAFEIEGVSAGTAVVTVSGP